MTDLRPATQTQLMPDPTDQADSDVLTERNPAVRLSEPRRPRRSRRHVVLPVLEALAGLILGLLVGYALIGPYVVQITSLDR